MRFRLIYRGKLKSNGSKKDKHDIRTYLAPQIQDLSKREPLRSFDCCYEGSPAVGWPTAPRDIEGITFVPLVFTGLHLIAHLDIMFLRPEDPGRVVTHGGDLDNRIKTLFDGLRVPSQGELPSGVAKPNGPVWCLLEDDALVTEFSVRTDRLLAPENEDDVFLVITVTVGASQHVIRNIGIASF